MNRRSPWFIGTIIVAGIALSFAAYWFMGGGAEGFQRVAVRTDMDDPDLAFVEEENDRLQFVIRAQLDDWIAWSDKIDELHDKIIADFQEPLPPFPHHANKMDFSSADYFRWMDSVLAGQGYELLLWWDRFDDNIYAFAVGRDDMARILELCTDIGVYAERATERRRC